MEKTAFDIPNARFVRVNLMHSFLHIEELEKEGRAIGISLTADKFFSELKKRLLKVI